MQSSAGPTSDRAGLAFGIAGLVWNLAGQVLVRADPSQHFAGPHGKLAALGESPSAAEVDRRCSYLAGSRMRGSAAIEKDIGSAGPAVSNGCSPHLEIERDMMDFVGHTLVKVGHRRKTVSAVHISRILATRIPERFAAQVLVSRKEL